MNKEWAMKWADYLEQDNLQQACHVLAQGNDTISPKCCLGHAEYMLGNRFLFGERPNSYCYGIEFSDGSTGITKERTIMSFLSNRTRDLFGMKDVRGFFETRWEYEGKLYHSLVQLNDNEVPLKEIAKCIRERWEEL